MVWQCSINKMGYGYLKDPAGSRKNILAHRMAWFLEHGEYPPYPEFVIDHLCRNRACVNVDHMELTSIGENVLRGDTGPGINKRKTHCKFGHSLIDAYVRNSGARNCRTCRVEDERRRRAEKRAS